MSAIPYPLDPLGVSGNSPYFEVGVKPGILNSALTYGIHTTINNGGYLKVVDWGDGTSEDATASGTLTHTYAAAGTYTIRIKANCRGIRFGHKTSYAQMVYDTNANWSALGELFTQAEYMFNNCVNAQFKIDKLPENIQSLSGMFSYCHKAELYIHKLPEKLRFCYAAFNRCYKAVINLDELTANAPAEGWSKGINIGYMFCDAGSGNSPGTVTGSRSAFLAKLPNATYTITAFDGTNTTQ